MIRINLIRERRVPGARKAVTPTGEGANPLVYVGMGIILLAAASFVAFKYISLSRDISAKRNNKAELEREKQRLEPIIRQKEELEAKRAELEKKIAVIKELRQRQQVPVRLLDELSRNLPEYVWFETLTETNSNVSLDAHALNPQKMADFVDNLTHSGYFPDVDLQRYGDERETTNFRLVTTFQLPVEPDNGAGAQ
jgi:type IV pilus assembly protein PilN